ncbi:MAG: hypothetical protein Q8920_04845 [Bacillota bacterium]|nr:hypothetical protein [Bacillota bacterium]
MPIGNFIKIAYLRKTAILSVCFSLCLSSTACSGNQADLAKVPAALILV